jgi:DNA-directed RNA polymerase specialized sigma24 family protein
MDPYFSYHEPEPELAPDLEWMLSTDQVPLPVIAEALYEAYYGPVYRLALALSGDRQAARRAVPRLLSAALAARHRCPAVGSVQIWLYRTVVQALRRPRLAEGLHALRSAWSSARRGVDGPEADPRHPAEAAVWRAIDQLDWPERMLLLLTRMLDLTSTEAAQAVQLSEGQAETASQWAAAICRAAWVLADGPELEAEDEEWLRESLQRRWPEPTPLDAEARAVMAGYAAGKAERSGQGKRKLWLLKETAALAAVISLVGAVLWATDRLPVGEDQLPESALTPPAGETSSTPSPGGGSRVIPYQINQDGTVMYAVQPGETWDEAASWLGVSGATLRQLNCLPPDGSSEAIGMPVIQLSPGLHQSTAERYDFSPLNVSAASPQPHIDVHAASGSVTVFTPGAEHALLIEADVTVLSPPYILFMDGGEAGHLQNLRWLDTAQPTVIHQMKSNPEFGSFSISPNGRQLALVFYTPVERVSLLDLHTGGVEHLANFTQARHLAWSPDGRFLAVVANEVSPQRLASKAESLVISLEDVGYFSKSAAETGSVAHLTNSTASAIIHFTMPAPEPQLSIYDVGPKARVYHQPVGLKPGQTMPFQISIPSDAPVQMWGIQYPPSPWEKQACPP